MELDYRSDGSHDNHYAWQKRFKETEAAVNQTEPDHISKLYGAICTNRDNTPYAVNVFYAALDELTKIARNVSNSPFLLDRLEEASVNHSDIDDKEDGT